jgi:hypothetical protein
MTVCKLVHPFISFVKKKRMYGRRARALCLSLFIERENVYFVFKICIYVLSFAFMQRREHLIRFEDLYVVIVIIKMILIIITLFFIVSTQVLLKTLVVYYNCFQQALDWV